MNGIEWIAWRIRKPAVRKKWLPRVVPPPRAEVVAQQCAGIIEVIRKHGPMTYEELGNRLGLKENTARRKISDAVRAGVVSQCRPNNGKAVVSV